MALNRAVALAHGSGRISRTTPARADLLRRASRLDESRSEYREAIALSTNVAERDFLEGRRREVS